MAAGRAHSGMVPAFNNSDTVTCPGNQPGADMRVEIVASCPDSQPAQPFNSGGIEFVSVKAPAVGGTGGNRLRQSPTRRRAEFRFNSQAVDQSTPLDGITIDLPTQRFRPAVAIRQTQMMQILHTDDQRRRRFSPRNGGNRLLQPGQIRPRPAILRRRGEAQKTALMQVREIVVGKVAAAIKLCRLFGHQLTNVG